MVKAKEENHWKQVTPDMMSEEEDENGEFIRHRPQWRSTSFNVFVEKLDKRYKLKHEKTLAKPRSYGTVNADKISPANIPSWMIDSTLTDPEPIDSDSNDSEEDV